MYAVDFEYDGQYLSDYGFIVCDFDSKNGTLVTSAGSKISFNRVSHNSGKRYSLSSTRYDECITTSFDICKDPDRFTDIEISDAEFREIARWLNRREFLRFRGLQGKCDSGEESNVCYFDASFNIDKITVDGRLYGIRLTMETDKPFGYGDEVVYVYTLRSADDEMFLYDTSDEIGYLYPQVKITLNANGNLRIDNDASGSSSYIKNCIAGEVITMSGDTQIISTSRSGHDIYDDFNYDFMRISNTFRDRSNRITATLPCSVEIRYAPIIKDVP